PDGGAFSMQSGPPTLADVLPPMLQYSLNLTAEQWTKLEAIQKEVVARLEAILDAFQKTQLLDRRAADPPGFAGMATPGVIMPLPTQILLKLSADQRTAVAALQKEVDGKIEILLDDAQKDQIKQTRERMAREGRRGGRVRVPVREAPDLRTVGVRRR